VASSEVRQLVGDLVVASVELCGRPLPAPHDVKHAFADWFVLTEPWLRIAIECAAASAHGVEPELIDALAEVFEGHTLLASLRTCVEDRFTYLGTQDGELYAPVDWEQLCLVRSGLEIVRDLLAGHAELADQLATARIERDMARWGPRLARAVSAPADMPAHHWWWRASQPPGEATLQLNERMRGLLLAVGGADVPARLRRFVERGFTFIGGSVFFHGLVGEEASILALRVPRYKSAFEAQRNIIQLESYLDLDDSRRLVDLAGTTVAATRFVASELRRRGAPPCTVLATLRPTTRTSVLRFWAIRAGVDRLVEDAESIRDEAVVLVDTVD
jgi:hypothetical protein